MYYIRGVLYHRSARCQQHGGAPVPAAGPIRRSTRSFDVRRALAGTLGWARRRARRGASTDSRGYTRHALAWVVTITLVRSFGFGIMPSISRSSADSWGLLLRLGAARQSWPRTPCPVRQPGGWSAPHTITRSRATPHNPRCPGTAGTDDPGIVPCTAGGEAAGVESKHMGLLGADACGDDTEPL
jgi:hypothetical protein